MVAWTIDSDYSSFDGLEAVTLIHVSSFSTNAGGIKDEVTVSVAISSALRRNARTHEIISSGGAIKAGDVQWSIPADLLGGIEPIEGDRLQDASGASWIISSVEIASLASRRRCWTRKHPS